MGKIVGVDDLTELVASRHETRGTGCWRDISTSNLDGERYSSLWSRRCEDGAGKESENGGNEQPHGDEFWTLDDGSSKHAELVLKDIHSILSLFVNMQSFGYEIATENLGYPAGETEECT